MQEKYTESIEEAKRRKEEYVKWHKEKISQRREKCQKEISSLEYDLERCNKAPPITFKNREPPTPDIPRGLRNLNRSSIDLIKTYKRLAEKYGKAEKGERAIYGKKLKPISRKDFAAPRRIHGRRCDY